MNTYEAIHPPNHYIVKQYRKGLTAVVDRCVYMYPTIGTSLFRKVLFVAVLVETRACRPRDACYPRCARHLTPLYVPVSRCARSATCKPCLWRSFQTVQSTAPGLQLETSIYRRATTLWAHDVICKVKKVFSHINTHTIFKFPDRLIGRRACPGLVKHTFPRLARSTLNELQQTQHEKASLVCVRVQSPSGLALVPCALSMVDLSGR